MGRDLSGAPFSVAELLGERPPATARSHSFRTTLSATSPDPRGTLLAFLQAAYEAGARLAGWEASAFESKWCPTPNQLQELQATAAQDLGRPGFGSAPKPT